MFWLLPSSLHRNQPLYHGVCVVFSKIPHSLPSLKHFLLFFSYISGFHSVTFTGFFFFFSTHPFHIHVHQGPTMMLSFSPSLHCPCYFIKPGADCLDAYFNHFHTGYEPTLEAVSITESNKVHQQLMFDLSSFQNTSPPLSAIQYSFCQKTSAIKSSAKRASLFL